MESVILFLKTAIYCLFRQPSEMFAQTEREALLIWSTNEYFSAAGNSLVS